MATGFGGGEGVGGNSKDRIKIANSKVYSRKSFKGLKTDIAQEHSRNLPPQLELNSRRERGFNRSEVGSDDSSSLKRTQSGIKANLSYCDNMHAENGIDGSGFLENRVLVSLGYKTKKERRELRRKLEGELNMVRGLVKKLERCGNNLRPSGNEGKNGTGKLKRVHSEVGSVGWQEGRPVDQLRVTVSEHSQGGVSDNLEKEKRTPKVNQFYQSSDFILGKERIPVSEQNKKSKSAVKKNGESGSGTGMGNQSSKVFKNCSLLLDKLMKHKHGWVFNTPVDVKALGLHDYFTIIKHPMDLGTVKSRLNTNWYKSPKEFAEDVRLTFQNAMKYNPKGHDVHIMADILLTVFEEKWGSIETDYIQDSRASANHEASLSTPTSRKASLPAPPPPPLPVDVTKTLDRAESMTNPVGEKRNVPHATRGRKPVPKKPKAKDPNKRDMTYMEKQKLSTELQNLPSEKLDNVVQIIRKRNPSLCQNDDEIEVDIDSVDTETLWELDRFVMNYKKSINKIKKRAEVDQVAVDEPTTDKEQAPSLAVESKENKTVEKDALMSSPVQHQKQAEQAEQAGNASKSNSSKSSGSDSGSSSSDSDSDSSTA
ncbi:hypothetical protein KSS87_020925 [Heliosperma pusillum]|nr:hypothetical protein KSS87_020925 [Heliosperma pusillum]